MKLRQFPESLSLSSWRTQEIKLAPHEQLDIGFYDTKPNIFMVNNPNEATLKFGISKMPTSNRYEYKINYSSSDVFGRPTGTGHLYALNDSSIEVSFTLFSITKDFDPEIMKGTNVLIDLDNLETRAVITGVTEGFKLPVDTSAMENTLSMLNMKLGRLSRQRGTAQYYNNAPSLSSQSNKAGYVVFEWLFNDGDDADITIAGETVFTIKKGEGFGDFEFLVQANKELQVKSSTGTASLRAKFHVEYSD